MRVDFYQVSRDPVPEIVALLARNTLKAGERLLVVADRPDLREAIGEALWRAAPADSFLANGQAGDPHAARQPVLLSDRPEPANGARFCVLADGVWREAEGFERTFLVFDEATLGAARACWRMLGERDGLERHFWKQDGGRWIRAA
ncbi:DNA polymerase III subunit chi [Novosphingobium aerophilum]|uniref:DNA polymerase III subunit chi n=1 Tax=Novosphingobium aerophilum TaxID=2839843 RepID=A0A7X1KD76_9SPHN|nr:DNA polymerase III subunit chi [Novosphingobium aerophilum]MBC2652867.1 DNA polymerase III subunit chi [Novosphingobium aerophilum]